MHRMEKVGKIVLFYCYMTEKKLKASIRTVSFNLAEKFFFLIS